MSLLTVGILRALSSTDLLTACGLGLFVCPFAYVIVCDVHGVKQLSSERDYYCLCEILLGSSS